MPANYDPNVIQNRANELYRKANSAMIGTTGLGVILGAIAGALLQFAPSGPHDSPWTIAGVVIGGLLGFLRARSSAAKLKVEAQLLLNQLQQEKNTRSAAVGE